MFAITSLAIALCAVKGAFAHGGVMSYSISGNWYKGVLAYNTLDGQDSIQRPWYTYDPIQDSEGATIACNNAGESLTRAAQLTATVKAGSAVTAYWNTWGHNTGPMLTYLAQCPGSTCSGVDSTTVKWFTFKIDEAGLLSGTVFNSLWGAGKMISQNSSWTTTIPSTVPSGNYLIRFETIALHALPAQHYPECAQITITDGGTLHRPPLSWCTRTARLKLAFDCRSPISAAVVGAPAHAIHIRLCHFEKPELA